MITVDIDKPQTLKQSRQECHTNSSAEMRSSLKRLSIFCDKCNKGTECGPSRIKLRCISQHSAGLRESDVFRRLKKSLSGNNQPGSAKFKANSFSLFHLFTGRFWVKREEEFWHTRFWCVCVCVCVDIVMLPSSWQGASWWHFLNTFVLRKNISPSATFASRSASVSASWAEALSSWWNGQALDSRLLFHGTFARSKTQSCNFCSCMLQIQRAKPWVCLFLFPPEFYLDGEQTSWQEWQHNRIAFKGTFAL